MMHITPQTAKSRDDGIPPLPSQNHFQPEMELHAANEIPISSIGRFRLPKLLAGALVFSLLVVLSGASASTKIAVQPTFQDTVTAVTADSITIKTGRHAGLKVTQLADLGQKESTAPAANVEKLKIDKFTRITVDGLPGTAADLKAGMIVQVTQGTDRDVAGSIDAHSVPPPLPATKSPATTQPAMKGTTTKAAFRKISSDMVMAVSPTRITVGQPGAKAARAYYVTAATAVTIDGVAASPADLQKGMIVTVRGDSTTAEEIVAYKSKAYMSQ